MKRRAVLPLLPLLALAACSGTVVVGTGGSGSSTPGNGTGGSGPSPGCMSNGDCLDAQTCDTTVGICMPLPNDTCQQCACMDLISMGGCADVCKSAENGPPPPNFCDGAPALTQCKACLAKNCAQLVPDPNNPAACM